MGVCVTEDGCVGGVVDEVKLSACGKSIYAGFSLSIETLSVRPLRSKV